MSNLSSQSWIPDWSEPEQYKSIEQCSRTQLAWQFLRRNIDYQSDWYELDRLDPIQTSVSENGYSIVAGPAWAELGAKWGVSGAPPCPAEEQPRILFFDSSLLTTISPYYEDLDTQIALSPRIRSELVLRVQIDRPLESIWNAVKPLIKLQKKLLLSNSVTSKDSRLRKSQLTLYLRLLDADSKGDNWRKNVEKFYPHVKTVKQWNTKLSSLQKAHKRAKELVALDYLELAEGDKWDQEATE